MAICPNRFIATQRNYASQISIVSPVPLSNIDVGDGQFSERCDVDGSFFNNDAIPIIFWKDLTSPSLRLVFLTIGNDYFSITLLILRTDYFAIIHDMPDPPDPAR